MSFVIIIIIIIIKIIILLFLMSKYLCFKYLNSLVYY